MGHHGNDDLAFTAQRSNEDGSRPDLVGRAIDGREPIVIEAKFWAGLTGHQPVSYLGALPAGGLLLFVAPAGRIDTLWTELLRRAGRGNETIEETTSWPDARKARVSGRIMALVSWRKLLGQLR